MVVWKSVALEPDDLGLDYSFECVFWVIAGFIACACGFQVDLYILYVWFEELKETKY